MIALRSIRSSCSIALARINGDCPIPRIHNSLAQRDCILSSQAVYIYFSYLAPSLFKDQSCVSAQRKVSFTRHGVTCLRDDTLCSPIAPCDPASRNSHIKPRAVDSPTNNSPLLAQYLVSPTRIATLNPLNGCGCSLLFIILTIYIRGKIHAKKCVKRGYHQGVTSKATL